MKKIFILFYLFLTFLYAEVITSDLEYKKISGVGYGWQTVNLANSYSNAIVVCSNVLPSSASNEAVTRVRSVGSGSFQVKIQQPNDSNPGYSTDVYCIISDEGSYTVPFKYEAHKVTSRNTSGNNANGWNGTGENVTGAITNSYSSPAVLGQVMSYNDNRFSVFWSYNCSDRRTPYNGGNNLCVGKHVSKIAQTRNNETLGYIVAESGRYDYIGFDMSVALGANSIRGVDNAPPYTYSLGQAYTHGVVNQEAENGGDGGWGVLYGSSPIGSSLSLAIDEAMINNVNRTHTAEQVAYWVFSQVTFNYADMVINEVMYREKRDIDEFIEFYVTSSGNIQHYLFTDQDGVGHQYRFPDKNVNSGDYVILHIGDGTDTTVGNAHHFYMDIGAILDRNGDDIVLLKPSTTHTTTVDGVPVYAIPVDYIAYGSGGSVDGIPLTTSSATVSWNSAYQNDLSGSQKGQSVSLTPNATDSDKAGCWELTASGDASNNGCSGYLPTAVTDARYKHSRTDNNNLVPDMSISKTSIVISDPVNNTTNPKRIPGATIRYCFTVDNSGDASADSVTIDDVLTGSGKDNLSYVNSGRVIQNIGTACNCAAITDTSGTKSGTDVTINIGTLTHQSATPATARACAYIEITID